MDISQVRYEPWRVVRQLGKGSYGSVFEIQREEFGELYTAALKVISIPQSDEDIIANRADGMTDKSMASYYHSVVKELTHELALLSKLKGNTNIVGYEDHKIVQHPDGIGWDIYIRMELLTSLTAVSAVYDFSRNQVVQIGIDICNALELCEKNNILHRDIKPDNIFISGHGDYKLGDFGIARTASQTAANMSTKGTPNYMAPEVYKGLNYDATVDIYSLGIVLYQMMNGKRLPFIPVDVTLADREAALGKRMSGEPFPEPEMADEAFAEVILKACAFDPKARYANARQMKKALEKLIEGVYVAPIDVKSILGPGAYVGAQGGYTQPGSNSGGYAQPGNNSGGYAQPGNNSGGYAQPGNNSGAYAPGGYSQQGVNKGQDSFVQPASYIQQGGYPQGQTAGGYAQGQTAGGYAQGQTAGGYSGQYGGNYGQSPYGQNAGQGMNKGGFDATAGYTQQGGNMDPNSRSYVPAGNVPSAPQNQPGSSQFDLAAKEGPNNTQYGGSGGQYSGNGGQFGGNGGQYGGGGGRFGGGNGNQYGGGNIGMNGGAPSGGKKPNFKLIGGIAAVAVIALIAIFATRRPKPGTVTTKPTPTPESTTASTESKTESKPATTSTAGTNSGISNVGTVEGLSDSLDDYTFELDGVVMKLPVSYEEFASHGWSLYSYDNSDTEEDLITAQDYDYFQMTNGDGRIRVYIYNPSGDTKPLRECKIGCVEVTKDEGISFKIAGGLELGASADDVLAKFGTPASNNTSTDYQTIKYKTGEYSRDGETEFYFRTGHSADNSISLKYMPVTEEDVGEVSTERPAYLDTYAAPTELSADPTQTVFQLGGDLYQLPCTIDAFLNNGWTVSSKSVNAIASMNKESYAMELSKDGYSIDLTLGNYEMKAALAENCAVLGVSIETNFRDGEMPGDYAVFSGGIKLGSTLDEFTAALGSFETNSTDMSTSFSYNSQDYSTKLRYYLYSSGDYKSNEATLYNENWNY